MTRGPIPITKRSDLARPINASENDENLDNLREGILHSTESPDSDTTYGVVADVANTAAGLDPDEYVIRGVYHEIKDPAVLSLPAAVTDDLVMVTTHKLRLNTDDGAAVQVAYSQTAGAYVRSGTQVGGWGAWSTFTQNASDTTIGLVELATSAETQTGTDTVRAVTPAGLASLTSTDTRRGLIELATQTEVNTGTDVDRAVTPATLAGRTATETRAGIIEIATTAETAAGTDDARAVTPLKLAGTVATATARGLIELATQAEVNTGTDPDRAVTPATLAGRAASTSQTGLVELATTAETQTGTDTARAVTPAGLRAALGGSKTYDSGQQTITISSVLNLTHGLTAPFDVFGVLECTSAELGYSVGDKWHIGSMNPAETNAGGIGIAENAAGTQFNVVYGNQINILRKDTQAGAAITVGNWRLRVKARG